MTTPFRRRWMPAIFALIAIAALALVACGDDDDDSDAGNDDAGGDVVASAGDIEIIDPHVRFTLGNTAAAHLIIRNNGDEADRLVSASSNLDAMVQVHEVVTSGGSGMMQELEDGLEIPANSDVELKQGGYHVMIMDIDPELSTGDEVELTLVFENAGEVTFTVEAEQLTSGAIADDDDGEHAVAASVGDIEIHEPHLRFTLGNTAAGHMVIVNTGDEADRLVSANSSLDAIVEIHEVVTDGGTGTMRELEDGLDIPANEEVALQPGGYHIMLMNITPELASGDEVELTLVFERAGEVTFTLAAEQMSGGMGMGTESGGGMGTHAGAGHQHGHAMATATAE